MDIDEIKQLKQELKDNILELMYSFESKSGLVISDISLGSNKVYGINKKTILLHNVDIEVKL